MTMQTIQNTLPKQPFVALPGCLSNRNAAIEATIAELARQFPAAFAGEPSQVRPLKLGVLRDIFAQSVISHRRIAAALRWYCTSAHYLKASTVGAIRVDLGGLPAGSVTAKEAEFAHRRLIAKRTAAGKPASEAFRNAPSTSRTAQAPKENGRFNFVGTAATASQLGPRRLGLADLKRAAVARKAAGG
jgi:sRNA-binding protein